MTTQLANTEQLVQELLRLQPAEVLFPTDAPNPNLFASYGANGEQKRSPVQDAIPSELPDFLCYTIRSQTPFLLVEAKQKIMETFKVRSLEGFGCAALSLAIRAAGGTAGIS
jgi:DNA mismatch repair protein MutS